MIKKNYRLKVNRIPLSYNIPYKNVEFPAFKELHLDLLENENKLKMNPPQPIYTRKIITPPTHEEKENKILDNLEEYYYSSNKNDEDIFSEDDFNDENISENNYDSNDKNLIDEKSSTYNTKEYEDNSENNTEQTDNIDPELEKEELLHKLNILRTRYKSNDLNNINIPEFSEHSDLETMRKCYNRNHRIISLKSNVDAYKNYLNKGMVGMEFLFTYFFGIDLSGLAQSQQNSNQYDELLEELGEKNYSPVGSSIPVEIRLLGLIIFQSGMFYVSKQTMNGNILNMMTSNMNGNMNGNMKTNNNSVNKKMKGPTIKPDDLNSYHMEHNNSDSD